ncbi:hypothetical protein [Halomonas huangheensis]|uniref:Uncharacterized protein n=1 Tax=Halomonas huangheensis TaxID=1178482 RepID=W1NB93_9GAMM|nr:hypothetical protein [Halomonas huangheensis]ALM52674.1 hypothetical protein AR456_10575 [Halomonas huangheensis]ERL52802.1 hypothetical protein BJB45_16110 [Halomonas huangheensis]
MSESRTPKVAGKVASPARLSLMVGLMIVLALTLPRYSVAGHATRETLGWIILGVLALASLMQWRFLDGTGRSRFLRLLFTLIGCLVVGMLAMIGWKVVGSGVPLGLATLSQGATAGLLLYAIVLIFARKD